MNVGASQSGSLARQLAWPITRWSYPATCMGRAAVLRSLVRAWHFVLSPTTSYPDGAQARAMLGHMRRLFEQDLQNVEDGYYPQELLVTPLWRRLMAAGPKVLPDGMRVWWRRLRKRYHDIPALKSPQHYPPYYLRNFHWQTDGWFSERSARMYDPAVELLFFGTADIMRRMTIPPLKHALAETPRPRILDVACGTGRYLHQLAQSLPEAKLYGLDLSPQYIQFAKSNLKEWPEINLVHDKAEDMPFADSTFDATTSIYLFHELPLGARKAVLKEMHRVTKPGGCVILCDSAQARDATDSLGYFEFFPKFYHEPYYKGYFRRPLESLAEEAGLHVARTDRWYISKVIVCRKLDS